MTKKRQQTINFAKYRYFQNGKNLNMTPKEKAIDLYNKFFTNVPFLTAGCHPLDDYNAAKQCALIAVDEILNMPKIASLRRDIVYMELEYWMEVKEEIQKL